MALSNLQYRMGGPVYKSPFESGYFQYQESNVEEPVEQQKNAAENMYINKVKKKKKRPKSATSTRKKEVVHYPHTEHFNQDNTAQLIDNMNTVFTTSDNIPRAVSRDALKFTYLKKSQHATDFPQSNISTQLLKESKQKSTAESMKTESRINQENILMYKQLLLSLQEANHYATLLDKPYYFQIMTAPNDQQLKSGSVKYDKDTLIKKSYSNGVKKSAVIMNVQGFYKLHGSLQKRYYSSVDKAKQRENTFTLDTVTAPMASTLKASPTRRRDPSVIQSSNNKHTNQGVNDGVHTNKSEQHNHTAVQSQFQQSLQTALAATNNNGNTRSNSPTSLQRRGAISADVQFNNNSGPASPTSDGALKFAAMFMSRLVKSPNNNNNTVLEQPQPQSQQLSQQQSLQNTAPAVTIVERKSQGQQQDDDNNNSTKQIVNPNVTVQSLPNKNSRSVDFQSSVLNEDILDTPPPVIPVLKSSYSPTKGTTITNAVTTENVQHISNNMDIDHVRESENRRKPELLHTSLDKLNTYQAIEYRKQISVLQGKLLEYISTQDGVIKSQMAEIKQRGWNAL